MRPSGKRSAFRPRDPLLNDEVLDDATRRALLENLHRDLPAPAQRTVAADTNSVDITAPALGDGLTSTLLTRLAALEKQVQVQQRELNERGQRIVSLQDHLADTKAKLQTAEHEKLVLAERLADMNKFLADYDLTFVGSEDAANDASSAGAEQNGPAKTLNIFAGSMTASEVSASVNPTANTAASTDKSAHDKLPFDWELLVHQAEKLTWSIAHKTVETNGKTGVIKERDTVQLCVYSDGICVNSGLFRPFGWPLCDAFLTDLLDGYFPYEFRERYPDGFPINVVDKSDQACPLKGPPARASGVNEHGYKPMDRKELLRRLPQQYVTASGKLVDVKSGVADFIGATAGSSQPLVAPQEPVRVVADTPAHRSVESEPPRPTTSIRVKFAQGHDVTLKMFHDDTVADLRKELLAASAAFFAPPANGFELCSVYPRRTFSEHGHTLADAGLVPSAALQIKLIL